MSVRFQFCPTCAKPLETAEEGGAPRQRCPDRACGFIHWDNPAPVVAAIVEHEGRIVLARNAAWPVRFFGLITGFLEKKEDPASAALREVGEELGLTAHTPSFVGLYPFERMNQLIIAYHVLAEGQIRLNEELSEYKCLAPAELKAWPSSTGLALRDWLRSRGIEPPMLEMPVRPTGEKN